MHINKIYRLFIDSFEILITLKHRIIIGYSDLLETYL